METIKPHHTQAVTLKIANELQRVGIPREAAEVFLKREHRNLSYDPKTDTLRLNGKPLAQAFVENPLAVNLYKADKEIPMTKSAFKAACLRGDQFHNMAAIKLIEDTPEKVQPGPDTMSRAKYAQAMREGRQGLDQITHFCD